MAVRQAQRQENGCILPSNINQGIFSIFAFDNNDLLEETLSGHGNIHCTNGIVIQRQQIGQRAYQEQDSNKKKTKKHSFEGAQVQVLHYYSGKRLNPDAINLSEDQLKSTSRIQEMANQTDFGWLLVKISLKDNLFQIQQENQVVPSWKTFNAIISKDQLSLQSTIRYCQTIDSSITNMATVYTLLKQSVTMGDQLSQQDIMITFDLAIYAKAVDVIWKNSEELS